ncbi:MAG: hypothetical protein IID39_05635 [Planctomycetes bacterium]|nr:hypothetical protein [Planctomycetota bacterium]
MRCARPVGRAYESTDRLVRAGVRVCGRQVCIIGVLICAISAPGANAQPLGSATASTKALDLTGRLVHHFDFDERDQGNLEAIPKFWTRFGGEAFPHYVRGGFDTSIGHDAPPSFHLVAEGRSVAYRYGGEATPVDLRNDFLIVGWIRGDGLVNARAALSAYYVDHKGVPIRETQRFSQLIGGGPNDNGWSRVEILLPGGPEPADTIGLTTWLVQAEVWDQAPKPVRHVVRRDVHAAAWFDDLKVYRLPRLSIEASAPGNVFQSSPSREAALFVQVQDTEPIASELTAKVTIFDVDNRLVRTVEIPIHADDGRPPIRIDLDGLKNGMYRAQLSVFAGDKLLIGRERQFVSVGAPYGRTQSAPVAGFGVVLNPGGRSDPLTDLALLRALNVGAVKIPVWSGQADAPDLTTASADIGTMMYELVRSGVVLTAVLAGPPSEVVQAAGAYPRSLLDLLSSDPSAWREHLARVVVPYSNMFEQWQVGADEQDSIATSERLPEALSQLQAEMAALSTGTKVSIPGSITLAPFALPAQADDMCLKVHHAVLPRFIADHLADYRRARHPASSVYLEPTPVENGNRLSRLRDRCRRLILAFHAGFGTVFVPQPWRTYVTQTEILTEPDEEFVLLHTVIGFLGGTTPGPPIRIAEGVTCLTFQGSQDRTVLALWDDYADAEGRTHVIQLGHATTQYDMWGRPTPLARAQDGRHIVRLYPEPTFITDAENWLLQFRTQLTLTPQRLPFSIATHEHTLHVTNTYGKSVAGRIRLVPPETWGVTPREIKFSLPPGGTLAEPIEIHYGRSEVAGTRVIRAEVDLKSDQQFKVVVPLTLALDLEDVDAWGYSIAEGDHLIVRHGVTNRSEETLNFRSFALAPGRPRQHRLLNSLLPGQTRTLEYRFTNAAALRGRTIRLHLRELSGPRIHNIELRVE